MLGTPEVLDILNKNCINYVLVVYKIKILAQTIPDIKVLDTSKGKITNIYSAYFVYIR